MSVQIKGTPTVLTHLAVFDLEARVLAFFAKISLRKTEGELCICSI